MSYFDCRLQIGYKANDADTPIVDNSSNPVPWANLTATQRTNLLGALQAPIKAAFPEQDPGNDNAPYFDLWQSRMISIGDTLSNQEVEVLLRGFLNKRLDEAAGNDVFKAKATASHIEYTQYDDKIVCEHYFQVLNENDTPWQLMNVDFDSGPGPVWKVSAVVLEIGIRFSAV